MLHKMRARNARPYNVAEAISCAVPVGARIARPLSEVCTKFRICCKKEMRKSFKPGLTHFCYTIC